MSYRLFAALPLPEDICEILKSMQKGLDGAKWRHKENLHLTLKFYGDVQDATARDLDAALANISLSRLSLRLSNVGQFGGYEPHTLWTGVSESQDLIRLSNKCSNAGSKLGIKKDKHAYTPHVTLAYLKGIQPIPVADYLERHAMFETPEFTIDRFALYSSQPGKYQSLYQEEASYPLI